MKHVLVLMLVLASAAAAQKTVTNADLEKFRQEREASEARLREEYKRKGWGSPEQQEREREERRRKLEAENYARRSEEIAGRNDIIAEANELRRRIAAVDAQIAYLQNSNGSQSASYRGGQVVYGSVPFGYFGGGFGYGGFGGFGGYGGGYGRGGGGEIRQSREMRRISQMPPNMRTVQENSLGYPSSQGVFRQSVEGVRVAPSAGRGGGGGGGGRRGVYRNGGGGGFYGGIYGGGGFYPTVVYQDQPSTGSVDVSYLLSQRAGLLAEWRLIEEKARRAGVRLD